MISALLKVKFIANAKKILLPRFAKEWYVNTTLRKGVNRLKSGIQHNRPLKIVIGASSIYQKGWVPTEEKFLDILEDSNWQKFFEPESIDAIMAEHVWEHISEEGGLLGAINAYKYLRKGGYMRIAVPDGLNPDQAYHDYITPPSLGHRVLYNYKNLTETFTKAGFKVKLLEYYDENHVFHYNHWSANDGLISRSLRFDKANQNNKTVISSVIIDAIK